MDNTRIEITVKSSIETTTNADRRARLFEDAKDRLRLAEGLLVCLHEAKRECEAQLSKLEKNDPMKSVTGRSSLDEKITSTTRMAESLKRIVDELAQKMCVESSLSHA